jgi:hypothetical protein
MNARFVAVGFSTVAVVVLSVSLLQHGLVWLGLIDKPIWLLDADVETSVPTWLAVVLLYSVSGALLATALDVGARPAVRNPLWWLLSAGFLVLSLDEYLAVHERFDAKQAASLGIPAELAKHADWWPVPIALMGLLLLRLLFRLPSRTRTGFIAAGTLYAIGVVGLDVAVPAIFGAIDHNSILGAALVTAEEGFELAGAILMLFTVLRFRETMLDDVTGRELVQAYTAVEVQAFNSTRPRQRLPSKSLQGSVDASL